MKSLVEENYLKSLYILANENGEVTVNDLSQELGIKMPTVTGMMKKFAKKNWVSYESYKPIKLTEKGKKEAALIVRKHRLTEMFLVEVMKIGWDEVHNIAEQVEHIKSSLFFDKMDAMLNYPKFDPHGSPIPDKNGVIHKTQFKLLTDCSPNENLIFRAVNHSTDDFLKYLNQIDFTLNTPFLLQSVQSFDSSRTIYFKGKSTVLSLTASEMILVEPNSNP